MLRDKSILGQKWTRSYGLIPPVYSKIIQSATYLNVLLTGDVKTSNETRQIKLMK